ncbi:hypothetical protein [Candidatus Thioglobus sp.]|uniref:hypothetical protein n=1 Tax=Candidatus Thioglobus sp. TaxID=2026721 RepID=UPI00262D89CF|nr:hypothetical protein [Candidatus Thioglobus sp.]MDG2395166.1 hypothetical protein [Candidatus Thioglobus sp.]
MKKILYYVTILVFMIAVVMVIFFDQITKSAMEFYGQKSFNAPISIAELRSDWPEKKINVDFVEVKNPAHFSNENAFVLNHLSASFSDETQKGLIVLDRLEFDGLLFTLEQKDQKVNLVELLKQLDAQSNEKNIDTQKEIIQGSRYNKKHRVKIKQLSIINTQLFIDTQWLRQTVNVPDVVIYEFGQDKGILLDRAGAEIMKIALMRIQTEVEKNGLKLNEYEIKESVRRQLRGKFNQLTDDLDDKAKNWFKKIGL